MDKSPSEFVLFGVRPALIRDVLPFEFRRNNGTSAFGGLAVNTPIAGALITGTALLHPNWWRDDGARALDAVRSSLSVSVMTIPALWIVMGLTLISAVAFNRDRSELGDYGILLTRMRPLEFVVLKVTTYTLAGFAIILGALPFAVLAASLHGFPMAYFAYAGGIMASLCVVLTVWSVAISAMRSLEGAAPYFFGATLALGAVTLYYAFYDATFHKISVPHYELATPTERIFNVLAAAGIAFLVAVAGLLLAANLVSRSPEVRGPDSSSWRRPAKRALQRPSSNPVANLAYALYGRIGLAGSSRLHVVLALASTAVLAAVPVAGAIVGFWIAGLAIGANTMRLLRNGLNGDVGLLPLDEAQLGDSVVRGLLRAGIPFFLAFYSGLLGGWLLAELALPDEDLLRLVRVHAAFAAPLAIPCYLSVVLMACSVHLDPDNARRPSRSEFILSGLWIILIFILPAICIMFLALGNPLGVIEEFFVVEADMLSNEILGITVWLALLLPAYALTGHIWKASRPDIGRIFRYGSTGIGLERQNGDRP